MKIYFALSLVLSFISLLVLGLACIVISAAKAFDDLNWTFTDLNVYGISFRVLFWTPLFLASCLFIFGIYKCFKKRNVKGKNR